MPTQLQQLLANFDRPGVTGMTLRVGKPITMRTPKGVMNVTGRALASEQLATLVRGTPVETLITDNTAADDPVEISLADRRVSILVERDDAGATAVHIANLVVRKVTTRDLAQRSRDKSSRPPAAASPAPRRRQTAAPATSRTRTAVPSATLIPPALAARPFVDEPPVVDDADADALELPDPVAPAPADVERPPPRATPANAMLRIDVSQYDAPVTRPDRDGSEIIALARTASMPLAHELRSLDALGLPADIAITVARERGLVLITAPRGHGKTSTLAALFDRIDRGVAPHVITIDELRDRESIDLALTMAESGYFVLATLTAPGPRAAVDALLDYYPGMAHGRVKTRLAGTLSTVIAKHLPPTPSEILAGPAVRTLLGD